MADNRSAKLQLRKTTIARYRAPAPKPGSPAARVIELKRQIAELEMENPAASGLEDLRLELTLAEADERIAL